MKILYIAPYYDGSGYSQAAIDYILAIDAAELNVVPRPIKLNNHQSNVPQRIIDLEQGDSSDCNICIQHMLPSMMEYDGRFDKNIALFAWETSGFYKSNWVEKLNTMDEVWVINNHQKVTCTLMGVRPPIYVIPHAINLEKFNQHYPKPRALELLDGNFIFYTIGEFIRRKNFTTLLQAFHLEFDPLENVELLIKTNQNIDKFMQDMRNGLKLYDDDRWYKKPKVLSHFLSEDELMGIHYHGNCFISTSFGEAWCLPATDALGFGKPIIVPKSTGFLRMQSEACCLMADVNNIPVFGAVESMKELYTSQETWYCPKVNDIRQCMRKIYENKNNIKQILLENGKMYVEKFSHDNVGKIIEQVLNEPQKEVW